jgi:DNA mismatch repair protein MutS2
MKTGQESIPAKTYSDLEWGKLLEHLAARCRTEDGAERARGWRPRATAQEARDGVREIEEARRMGREGEPLVVGVDLSIRKSLKRLAKQGILDAESLWEVARVLEAGANLRRKIMARKEEAPLLAKRAGGIRALTGISAPIRDSFTPGGELRDEASAELGSLRKKAKSLREEIVERLKEMMEKPDIERLLQDKYYTLREQRYVLPVKVEMQHLLPGIVHARSQTEATVFLEPAQITELGNRFKMALSDVELEERRVLMELSGYVREEIPAVEGNLEVLAQLDVISAGARLADDLEGEAVEVGEGEELALHHARHPLMVLAGERVVANDFDLGHTGSLVVTGPNAGGKTVALKTVGLACLMAQSGLHPPCAPGSRVPFYEGIFTSMGDDQDIAARLSTFTAHMTNLKRILDRAGEDRLVLLDEVAVGTEPTQGAALARALLEKLADLGAQVLVTTHYMALKSIAAEDPRFANAAMGFDDDSMTPTYRLERGALGRSSALSVARSLGLSSDVLERAEHLLGGQQMKLDGLLEDLEHRRRVVEERQRETENELAAAELERKRAEKKRKALAKELEEIRRQTHDKAVLELRSLRDELARLRKEMRSGPRSERRLAGAEKKAADAARKLSELAPEREGVEGRPVKKGELREGDEVVVKKMGAVGRVVDLDSKGRPTVQVGAVKIQAKPKDLLFAEGSTASKKKAAKKKKEPARAGRRGAAPPPPSSEPAVEEAEAESVDPHLFVRSTDTTLDLRGMRADEAVDELERFLDRMYGEEQRGFLIIHGYGTGALRKAVRERLHHSPLVSRFRPGRREEGGDGVTIVFFGE